MSNGGQQQQRSTYVESHAIAHAALQQHMAQQAAQARLAGPGPPAAPQPPNPTFTVPDDGLGYDDGVRVLRTIGSWCVKYTRYFVQTEGNSLLEYFFLQAKIAKKKMFPLKKNIFLYNIFNMKILFCYISKMFD